MFGVGLLLIFLSNVGLTKSDTFATKRYDTAGNNMWKSAFLCRVIRYTQRCSPLQLYLYLIFILGAILFLFFHYLILFQCHSIILSLFRQIFLICMKRLTTLLCRVQSDINSCIECLCKVYCHLFCIVYGCV